MSAQPLSAIVPPVVLGGAGFSNQLHPDPASLPSRAIISRAFELGVCAIDTSPYYGPSEMILGDALSQPAVTAKYPRSSYLLFSKAGRIAAEEFDYSPAWIRKSVKRSLERLRTPYLDVVFAHDVEFVTEEEAVAAVGELFRLADEGLARFVGISGYPIPRLLSVARKVREHYGRSLDAVQVWGQLTLQNTRLLDNDWLDQLNDAGVNCIFCSSPLAIGLLRSGGVPVGDLGDFHPAPKGLREAAARASEFVEERGANLAELALTFAITTALSVKARTGTNVNVVVAAGSIAELEVNWKVASTVPRRNPTLQPDDQAKSHDIGSLRNGNDLLSPQEAELVGKVREILGEWIDHSLGD
ncbi:NADP-dependent oxidoreductase domain-containing protein [Phyllosticta citriasiana]|uniref:NADP-dependent oxidoreductase domain-containing protein n=1 Tax=Phyllosticta citriasiana TaxID=595635 RepID=A0ABR1L0A3_9PEZI